MTYLKLNIQFTPVYVSWSKRRLENSRKIANVKRKYCNNAASRKPTFIDISNVSVPSESTGFTTANVVVPSLSRRRKPIWERKDRKKKLIPETNENALSSFKSDRGNKKPEEHFE